MTIEWKDFIRGFCDLTKAVLALAVFLALAFGLSVLAWAGISLIALVGMALGNL